MKNIYSLEEYDKAIYLHKLSYGSLRISKILGYKTRSAIEDWINKDRKPYYFSEKRIQACNSEENVERMRTMNKITQPKATKISAELRTKRLPENAKILSENLAYILGVVYGDGHVSVKQRRVILAATDKEFVLNFKNKLENWSGFKVRFFTRLIKLDEYIKNRKIQYVSYIDSVEASKFLKNFNLNIIKFSEDKTKCAFVKGFFDSEGTVLKIDTHSKNVGLGCSNTKIKLIFLIKTLLESLEMESKINVTKTRPIRTHPGNRPFYKLWIHKRENVIKFHSLIGFNINRKQERLEKQINYIKSRSGVTKMIDNIADRNTVFVGDRPFMK